MGSRRTVFLCLPQPNIFGWDAPTVRLEFGPWWHRWRSIVFGGGRRHTIITGEPCAAFAEPWRNEAAAMIEHAERLLAALDSRRSAHPMAWAAARRHPATGAAFFGEVPGMRRFLDWARCNVHPVNWQRMRRAAAAECDLYTRMMLWEYFSRPAKLAPFVYAEWRDLADRANLRPSPSERAS